MWPRHRLGMLLGLAMALVLCGLPSPLSSWGQAAEPEIHHAGHFSANGGAALQGSPGEKAQVSLFGVKAEGSKFVYVLDRSGSTEGKLLAAAKAEILASIEKIDDVHQFQLVVYNERPKAYNPAGPNGQLAFGTDANRAEVKRFLGTISADGGTDHAAALSMAIRMHPDVIFLLTDGDKPLVTAHELARIDRIGPGITIHAIQFGEGNQLSEKGKTADTNGWMKKLAKQSGGEYKYVDTTKLGAATK